MELWSGRVWEQVQELIRFPRVGDVTMYTKQFLAHGGRA